MQAQDAPVLVAVGHLDLERAAILVSGNLSPIHPSRPDGSSGQHWICSVKLVVQAQG
jgi:hypothetical protein